MRGRALQALRDGVELDDGMTAPARVQRLAPDTVEITIREGRKRQVRRMLEAVGHPVASLERVAFGPLGLKRARAGRAPAADRGGDRAPARRRPDPRPTALIEWRARCG